MCVTLTIEVLYVCSAQHDRFNINIIPVESRQPIFKQADPGTPAPAKIIESRPRHRPKVQFRSRPRPQPFQIMRKNQKHRRKFSLYLHADRKWRKSRLFHAPIYILLGLKLSGTILVYRPRERSRFIDPLNRGSMDKLYTLRDISMQDIIVVSDIYEE